MTKEKSEMFDRVMAALDKECEPDPVNPVHYMLPDGLQVVDVEMAMFGKQAVMDHCMRRYDRKPLDAAATTAGGGITMDIRPIDANALQEELQWLKQQAGSTNEDTYNDMMYRVCNRPTLSLNTLRDEIYQDAVAHGLWEEADAAKDVLQLHDCCVDIIAAEVCEMGEAWDNKDAFEEELADTIIASFSVAGKLGIDIDAAIRRKMKINKQRPWKHGKTE